MDRSIVLHCTPRHRAEHQLSCPRNTTVFFLGGSVILFNNLHTSDRRAHSLSLYSHTLSGTMKDREGGGRMCVCVCKVTETQNEPIDKCVPWKQAMGGSSFFFPKQAKGERETPSLSLPSPPSWRYRLS